MSGVMADERPVRFWQDRRPFVLLMRTGCPPGPSPDQLATARPDEGYGGKAIQLTPGALAAYRAACEEFDRAQEHWDPFLSVRDGIEHDSVAAEAAFERLRAANQARQDALDTVWLAWRNRPDPD